MRLYKRGRVWWFALEFEGNRHQKTTKSTNRRKAEGIAAAYRNGLAEGRAGIIKRARRLRSLRMLWEDSSAGRRVSIKSIRRPSCDIRPAASPSCPF